MLLSSTTSMIASATIPSSAPWRRTWRSHAFTAVFAVLALALVAFFYDQAVHSRVMLSFYYLAVTAAAYVLIRRRAMALMEIVVFAAVGRALAGVYFAATPAVGNPVLVVLGDLAFWFVVLYLGWRLGAEAYRFQKYEIRDEVAREVAQKAANVRGSAMVTTSREIRQPLATMRTITDALLNEPPETFSPAHQDSLADMDRCLNRLMTLVNNLLDFGQAEAGLIRLHHEPVTLPELVNQCVASWRNRAQQHGVEIRCHIDPDVGEMAADPQRLKQGVHILLANAVESNKQGGIVNLHARRLNGNVLMSVRDTGKGISSEEMEALFNPYRDDTQDDQQVYTSLGLSLAKRLVEMHGGSMTVDSVADSGSVFTIRLPIEMPRPVKARQPQRAVEPAEPRGIAAPREVSVVPAAASLISQERSRSPQRAKPLEAEEGGSETTRVLVADANASVRRILRQWLTALECEMIETDSGREVLELAHGRPSPHVILLDAQLPGMDGYEVCHAIKSDGRLQLIPVIVATSTDSVEEKIRAFDAGADDFLVKPINRAELTVRLRSLLRIYKFNQELIGAESVAMALARAVAAKDGYSQAHVGKVANYAVMFGEKLGLDVAELKTLKYGAILHNVGKIAIPDAVLEKAGQLTPREMAMFHRHPQIGCDICAPLKPLQPVLTIIRHHKERWDGSGYPDRLSGDQIPLGAQIVGIVAAYTALISNRPYRKALPHSEAIAILRKQAADGWYNPDLLERFIACVETTENEETPDEFEQPVAVETS